MLSLLFSTDFWYGLLITVAIVGIIFLAFKYPGSRVYIFSIFGLAMVGLTAYCVININYYYSASGGIYGHISGLLGINQVEKEDDLRFNCKNIVLTLDTNGQYSATIYSDQKVEVEDIYAMGLYVNDIPCSNNTPSINGISAGYHYVFQDYDMDEILSDTLNIAFSYFDNGYIIKMSTNSGQTVVDYWNTYFSRNNFVISLQDYNYLETDIFDDMEDSDVTNIVSLNYYVDDEIYSTVTYDKNSIIRTFLSAYKFGYTFTGWSIDKVHLIGDELTITGDTNLYAMFTEGEIILNTPVTIDLIESPCSSIYTFIDLNDYVDIDLTDNNIEINLDIMCQNSVGEMYYVEGLVVSSSNREIDASNDYGHWFNINLTYKDLYFYNSNYHNNSGYSRQLSLLEVTINSITVYA